ncbi:LysR family transcriptional regulator [Brucella sp. BE17]|uniref:LysR family transcriptional regulator n=1 Tax=Brucella sp. BE17 TaxID=3142977 RepID=UPI0031BA726A
MDRIEAMRIFARIVETRSFSQAARDLGIPASTASDAVKRIERKLGVRLIDRSTRLVVPTEDGEAWYARCLALVAGMEDAEAAFSGQKAEGRLHVNAHGTLARNFILPGLPAFLEQYPALDLVLSEGDALVDLLKAGVDCVVRVGIPADSELFSRRLGELEEVTLASPAYLERYGVPKSPDDLAGHRMVAFRSSATGVPFPLEFCVDGKFIERRPKIALTVTAADTLAAAARQGLGIIQAPRYRFIRDLAEKRLVEILPDMPPAPMPVSALYPRDRQLSPRVRVFLDWLGKIDFSKEPPRHYL